MYKLNSIAAIATGNTNTAISIIRVSGFDSLDLVSKISSNKLKSDKIIFSKIIDKNKKIIDEVLIAYFKSPKSFTGEDVVEIFAHGGVVNTHRIFQLILENGAIQAKKGEFSFRAVLNGKMSLSKSEAINDLINAENEFQAKAYSNISFSNKTNNLISNLKKKFVNIIGTCEVNIDYPEYVDVEQMDTKKLIDKLIDLSNEISAIQKNSIDFLQIRKGIKVVIVGRPNVGKSSLFNCLIGWKKAIVTEFAGTTRDSIEGKFLIDDVLFELIDTAGIRKTKNKIEKIGIEITKKSIENADLIIWLDDLTLLDKDVETEKILEFVRNKKIIKVFNKKDLLNSSKNTQKIKISCKNNELNELIEEIRKTIPKLNLDDDNYFWNDRQISKMNEAQKLILNALNELQNGQNVDTVIIDIRDAWECVESIDGKANKDILLDEIFSNFCLGK